jgi:hypothetical protein
VAGREGDEHRARAVGGQVRGAGGGHHREDDRAGQPERLDGDRALDGGRGPDDDGVAGDRAEGPEPRRHPPGPGVRRRPWSKS